MDQKSKTNFYKDIDDRQIHANNACFKVVLFFIILFIIGALILYFYVLNLRDNAKGVNVSSFDAGSNISKIDDSLTGEQTLTITETELNDALELNKQKLPIQYLVSDITPDGIKFKGIWKATSVRIEIVLLLRVENEKVVVKPSSVKIGKFNAPNWFAGSLSTIINEEIEARLKSQGDIKVISLVMDEEKILINFKQ